MSAASDASNASTHSKAQIFTRWVSALTLTERIEALKGLTFEPATHAGTANTEKIQAYLSRWSQAFARGDAGALERRMHWDQLDAQAVANALDEHCLALISQHGKLPSWASTLESALAHQRGATSTQIIPSRYRSCRFPFVELWTPWVDFLAQQVGSVPSAASIDASFWWDLKCHWLEQLACLGADLLYVRFQQTDSKNSSYRNFIKTQQQAGWASLLGEYPFLARQIGTFLEYALRTTETLIANLAADRVALYRCFQLDPLAQPCGFEPLGDTHGAAAVARIRFSDTSELIYKPRDCTLEVRWQEFVRTLNEIGLQPPLDSLACVLGHEHGWFSVLRAAQSTDRPAATRCFEQYGALVALAYVFGARDLHQDNVIVGANGPVLIDCETVLQPQGTVLQAAAESAMARAADALENSCLSSGLVRFPAENAAGERWDESALCGQAKATQRDGWFNLGSDQLLPGKIQLPASAPTHRVRCDDELLEPSDFLSELCQGFENLLKLLQLHHADPRLLAALQRFSDTRLRVVMRPTRSYGAMLKAFRSAKVQRDGLNAGLMLETLARIWRQHAQRPVLWPLLAGENNALLRGDVPVLYAHAAEQWLECEGQRVDGAWQESAMTALLRRLSELSDDSIKTQLTWLRSSLQSTRPEIAVPAQIDMPILPSAPPMAAGALRALVSQCAQQLLDAAVKGQDGELSWMAPSYLDASASKGRGVSHYLYDGSLGIAWFLAAAGRVLGKAQYTEAATQAIGPVRRFLRDPAAPLMIAKEPLGIAHGLGSVVAGLTAIARELNDPKLYEDAERAVKLIELRDLRGCEQAELESGLGGALLGICRLIEASGARTLLRSAKPIAARIAELFDSERGWRGYDGHALAGFMHGQSGIAYALNAYATLSRDAAALELANTAMRIEDRAFVHAAGDWALRLDHADTRCMGTWCNGAPGILLTRFAYGRKLDKGEYTTLERAALALHQRAISGVDHLCCGTLGAALSLAELSRFSARPEGLERAREWLAAVAQAAEQRGRFLLRVNAQENQCFQPGLYRGIAGVGFAALTLAWPEKVGSVLRFEGFAA